jgi:hypothetical protein
MARTIPVILSQMNDQQAAQPELAKLNSPSQTALYTLWKYITAVSIWIFEKLLDTFQTELETTIAAAPIGTPGWLQTQAFKFQYDSTTPQILELVDFVPTYEAVDPTKQLITQCSVNTLQNKVVSLKVAKNDPPEKLADGELTSFQGYLSKIVFAGMQYLAVSRDPDLAYVQAQITYDGQYSTTVSANTVTAINNYFRNIPFDGYFKVISLEDAIQSVPGVTDVVLNNVSLRPATLSYEQSTFIVSGNTLFSSRYPLNAGYVVADTTPHDFNSSLTFIPQ